MSDQKPALSLNVSYDHRSGAYLGGVITGGPTRYDGMEVLRHVTYAGYAITPRRGPSFDVGVSNYHVADYRVRRRTVDYTEVYAGVLTDHFSVRVHYAPDYYDTGAKTIYADLGASLRPAESIRLFAHAGLLTPVGGRPGARRKRYDFSAGISKQFARTQVSATWTNIDPQVIYANGDRDKRNALVLTASYFF